MIDTPLVPRRIVIEAGKLPDRIQIQTRDVGQDAAGQPLNSWTTWNTVWSRVESVGGMEPFRAAQFAAEVTHQVTVRWLDGLTPLQRILTARGQILDVLTVNYPVRKIEPVKLICKERISQGGDEDVG